MGYRLVRSVIRVLLALFYRRVDVVGAERIPEAGPLIVAANHHNAVVDAMLIVGTFPRPVRVLANAPLFRNPIVGPFLRLMGAVPVNRRVEAGDDPRKNDAMFDAAIAALRAGGALLIFPEGRTTPRPTLLPLRTGAARILFGAERAGAGRSGTTLLPVGLVFHDPGTFRAASALIMIGPPVEATDLATPADGRAEDGVRALTDRLALAIRDQIVEAEDHYTLELLRVLEQAWYQEQGGGAPNEPEAALAWRRRVMRSARDLESREPARMAELRRRIERYKANLDEIGIRSDQLDRPYTAGVVVRYVVENVITLMLGLPLALWGVACHAVPYLLVGRAVRWMGRTIEEEATDKIAAGLVFYPLSWILEAWLCWRLGGGWVLGVFLVLLIPSGLLALAWRERLERVGRQARAFARFIGDRRLRDDLRAERRALVTELTRLAALARETP